MIRVIIERTIAETMESSYENAAKATLQQAIAAEGFISGESLRDLNNPRHRMVLCKWHSAADWDRWFHSQERKDMMNTLNLMLESEERITLLESP